MSGDNSKHLQRRTAVMRKWFVRRISDSGHQMLSEKRHRAFTGNG